MSVHFSKHSNAYGINLSLAVYGWCHNVAIDRRDLLLARNPTLLLLPAIRHLLEFGLRSCPDHAYEIRKAYIAALSRGLRGHYPHQQETEAAIRQEVRRVEEELLSRRNSGPIPTGAFNWVETAFLKNGLRPTRESRYDALRAEGKTLGEINQILEQEGFSEVSGEGVMPAPTVHHKIVQENKGAKRMIQKMELPPNTEADPP